MANATEWFRHDAGARNDIKIEALTLRYGMAGYGMYWVIIEVLRQTDGYKLPEKGYVWSALASRMLCAPEQAEDFVRACIDEFDLLAEEDGCFWSESLLRRMEDYEAMVEHKRRAGKAGGEARAKQMLSTAKAAPKQNQARDSRDTRDSREEEYAPKVSMQREQYEKLCTQYGKSATDDKIQSISDYILSKGKQPYKDSAAAVRQWFRKDGVNPRASPTTNRCPECNSLLVDGICFNCEEGNNATAS